MTDASNLEADLRGFRGQFVLSYTIVLSPVTRVSTQGR